MRNHLRFARAVILAGVATIPAISFADATPRGPSFVVNSPGKTADQFFHNFDVAMAADGTFAVVWSGPGITLPNSAFPKQTVYMRRFAANGAPLAAEQVVSFPQDDSDEPSIAWNPQGGYVVAWRDFGLEAVLARHYKRDGSGLGLLPIVVAANGAASPRVAVRSDGDFAVVWSAATVMGRGFNAQGVPLGDAFGIGGAAGERADTPDLAFGSDGKLVAVWQESKVVSHFVFYFGPYARRCGIAGFNLGPIQTLSDGGGRGFPPVPSIRSNARGDQLISWAGENGLVARRITGLGNPIDPVPFLVGAGGYDYFTPTASLIDGADATTFAWVVAEDAPYQQRARRFDRSGVALDTPDFLVNDRPTTYFMPAIAGDALGNFVVVWQSGSSNDLRARLYRHP